MCPKVRAAARSSTINEQKVNTNTAIGLHGVMCVVSSIKRGVCLLIRRIKRKKSAGKKRFTEGQAGSVQNPEKNQRSDINGVFLGGILM